MHPGRPPVMDGVVTLRPPEIAPRMQLKTILNRVEPFKSFVYGKTGWVKGSCRPTLEVEVHARKNGRAICSGCGPPGPGYDRLPERRFDFVPLWGIAVLFVYALRRVDCPTCGVKGERCLGPGENATYQQLPLVPGPLGQAFVLAGGGLGLSHQLEKRVRVGKTRGFLGCMPPRPGADRGHRRGRDPVRPVSSSRQRAPVGSHPSSVAPW